MLEHDPPVVFSWHHILINPMRNTDRKLSVKFRTSLSVSSLYDHIIHIVVSRLAGKRNSLIYGTWFINYFHTYPIKTRQSLACLRIIIKIYSWTACLVANLGIQKPRSFAASNSLNDVMQIISTRFRHYKNGSWYNLFGWKGSGRCDVRKEQLSRIFD